MFWLDDKGGMGYYFISMGGSHFWLQYTRPGLSNPGNVIVRSGTTKQRGRRIYRSIGEPLKPCELLSMHWFLPVYPDSEKV